MITTITKRFYAWTISKIEKYKNRYYFKYLDICHSIKNYKYNFKIYSSFYKIPAVLRSFNYVFNHALLGLRFYREEIEERNRTIESLLEQLVETKLGDVEYTKEQEREAYREVYLQDSIAEIMKDGIPVFELPSEYMTRKEQNDAFDRDYEHHREVMCHCYDSIEEQIDYELDNGPLKKGGWYEKN
jgi:hypothetical protein